MDLLLLKSFIAVVIVLAPIWFVFSVAVAAVAAERGRSAFGWWVHAMFFSPIFSLACLAASPVLKKEEAAPAPASASAEPRMLTKDCPDCGETVKAAAKVCRFCGYRPPEKAPEAAPKLVAERVNPLMAAEDCRSCGAMMMAGDKRCKRCGVSVDPLAAP